MSCVECCKSFVSSPAAGILVGVVVFVLKDIYEHVRARQNLLAALNVEAKHMWGVIDASFRQLPAKGDVEAMVTALRAGQLDFATFSKMPAGIVFGLPHSLNFDVSKLTAREANVAIPYFDAWNRLVEREKRLAACHGKLLDLIPRQTETQYQIPIAEVGDEFASHIKGIFKNLHALAKSRINLEYVTTPEGTEADKSDNFECRYESVLVTPDKDTNASKPEAPNVSTTPNQ